MAKIEVDMNKVKEYFEKTGVKLEEPKETIKLRVINSQFFKFQGKCVFAFVLEDKDKVKYEFKMTSDPIYEDQIKKSLSRLRSVQIPSDEKHIFQPEPPKPDNLAVCLHVNTMAGGADTEAFPNWPFGTRKCMDCGKYFLADGTIVEPK